MTVIIGAWLNGADYRKPPSQIELHREGNPTKNAILDCELVVCDDTGSSEHANDIDNFNPLFINHDVLITRME